MIEPLMFYMFSALLILACIAVIFAKKPMYSVLFLIFAFFNTAGIFLLQKAEFLAMTLVIVYVGAVAVLFLFVVMLINNRKDYQFKIFTKYNLVLFTLVLVMVVEIYIYAMKGLGGFATPVANPVFLDTKNFVHNLGLILYDDYYYVFIVAGLILTVAMIGAVVLSLTDTVTPSKQQDVFLQNMRSKEESVVLKKVEDEQGIN
ncbi:NADH-quinone oxidoreductase subunit J [Candidatus Hepatincola sp. Av]